MPSPGHRWVWLFGAYLAQVLAHDDRCGNLNIAMKLLLARHCRTQVQAQGRRCRRCTGPSGQPPPETSVFTALWLLCG